MKPRLQAEWQIASEQVPNILASCRLRPVRRNSVSKNWKLNICSHPCRNLERELLQCILKISDARTVAAGRRHAPRAALCRIGIWRCENMKFWNLAGSGELALALQTVSSILRPLTLPHFWDHTFQLSVFHDPHRAVCNLLTEHLPAVKL